LAVPVSGLRLGLVHSYRQGGIMSEPAPQSMQRRRAIPAPRLELNPQGRWRIANAALAGTTILVVDDDHRNLLAMTVLLERGRADVLIAASGAEGIAILNRTPGIDLVLMDIMMPDMDGYETIRAIRAIDRFKVLPIIAVTGKVVVGERERCRAAGADDYVPKPVDTLELVNAIIPWLR
jgi:CheY-like chemotaxis protein